MSIKTQPLLAFQSQLDLVVGIGQINLCDTASTSQIPDQVLRKWSGLAMSLQLRINSYWVIPADPGPGFFLCPGWIAFCTGTMFPQALKPVGFHTPFPITSS